MTNKDFLVSVIVPIYNVDLYLDKCLSSIQKQIYTNIQVILVDDGSTDNSKIIAEKFIFSDNRFSIFSKSNGGLSSARNLGLEKVKGDFICFIDSDDYISEFFISDFVDAFIIQKADVSVCARYNVYNGESKAVFNSDKLALWTGKEALVNMLNWEKVDGSVCDKMFKASDFKKLRFKPGVVSEDLPVTSKIFSESNLVVHIGKPNYFYRQRDGSITNQNYSKSKLTILTSSYDVLYIVLNSYPELATLAKKYVLHHIHYLISIYLRSKIINNEDNESFKIVKKEFFKLISVYFLPNKRSLLRKIFLFLIMITNTQSFIRRFNFFLK